MPHTIYSQWGKTIHELDSNPQVEKYFDRTLVREGNFTTLTLKRKTIATNNEQSIPGETSGQQAPCLTY